MFGGGAAAAADDVCAGFTEGGELCGHVCGGLLEDGLAVDEFGKAGVGLGPVMQIAEGYTAELPEEVHRILDERTDPTWPTTWFVPNLTGSGPFRDVYSVMYNWGANHGAISYGHVGSDLITLASMLRIPVYMHNVSEERIFRPSTWTAFGALDPQGADFRACAAFGPLYG